MTRPLPRQYAETGHLRLPWLKLAYIKLPLPKALIVKNLQLENMTKRLSGVLGA